MKMGFAGINRFSNETVERKTEREIELQNS